MLLKKIITYSTFFYLLLSPLSSMEIEETPINPPLSVQEITLNDLSDEMLAHIFSYFSFKELSEIRTTASLFEIFYQEALKNINTQITNMKKQAVKNGASYYAFNPSAQDTSVNLSGINFDATFLTDVQTIEEFDTIGLSNSQIIKYLYHKYFKDIHHITDYLNNRWNVSLHVALNNLADKNSVTQLKIDLENDQSSLPVNLWSLKNLNDLKIKALKENKNSFWISPQLGTLKNLTAMDLIGLKAVVLPDSLINLKKLKNLDISFNYFPTLPENLGNLKNLEKLSLHHCHSLASLPSSMRELANLEVLNLEETDVSSSCRRCYNTHIHTQQALESLFYEETQNAPLKNWSYYINTFIQAATLFTDRMYGTMDDSEDLEF